MLFYCIVFLIAKLAAASIAWALTNMPGSYLQHSLIKLSQLPYEAIDIIPLIFHEETEI